MSTNQRKTSHRRVIKIHGLSRRYPTLQRMTGLAFQIGREHTMRIITNAGPQALLRTVIHALLCTIMHALKHTILHARMHTLLHTVRRRLRRIRIQIHWLHRGQTIHRRKPGSNRHLHIPRRTGWQDRMHPSGYPHLCKAYINPTPTHGQHAYHPNPGTPRKRPFPSVPPPYKCIVAPQTLPIPKESGCHDGSQGLFNSI